MRMREFSPGVFKLGAEDWGRRLFDALIPLPDGTTYNSYLVRGAEKTALLDTVDPTMTDVLLGQLAEVPAVDYVVAHHAEQDHSGSLPAVLERFPRAEVLCSAKARELLAEHLPIDPGRMRVVGDGEEVALGGSTLRFLSTPWVHWPETMSTYLPERRLLFSCDLFGSHFAGTDLYAREERVCEPAKRYFGEIMMPLRAAVHRSLEKLDGLDIEQIAPSHGPVYPSARFIVDAYRDWVDGPPRDLVVLAHVSMHGSTDLMVDHLTAALAERGTRVERFDLTSLDLGKLVVALVDAATVVVGTPTVLGNPHPLAAQTGYLLNTLRPKALHLGVIGSYGWATHAVETLTEAVSAWKPEVLEPVLAKGLPREPDLIALDSLSAGIVRRHRELGLVS